MKKLDISNNKLANLPPEFFNIGYIKELNLSGNQLESIPAKISLFSELTSLDLGNNKISQLPPEISSLSNLTHIDLSVNRLTVLPDELTQLKKLTHLDLRYNKLRELPAGLVKLPLQHLDFSDNPLDLIPAEIVRHGKESVLNYLRSRVEASDKKWVSKLLLVGEGGVGKTSLLRVLREEPFDTQESTTHGIEIKILNLPHPQEDGVTMRLNTWDLGGQKIYHAIHQFFISNHSLFLLAWNACLGFDGGKLYYWLDTLRALAPDSPVLLVATHIDQCGADLPFDDLQRKYPQIAGHCEISSPKGTGIAVLSAKIAALAAKLPLMGEVWPSAWLTAAQAVRENPQRAIRQEDLWKIFARNGVVKDSNQVLARWLHELGDILFFQENSELKEIVILKPQWVTEYISKVLENEDVIANAGVFTRTCMEQLWHDLTPSMREHLLKLMEQFDLSYRTLKDKDKSLVVERLSPNEAEYRPRWEAKNDREITLRFHLNTLPAGIPTRFIARSHRFTTHTHWSTGALFCDEPFDEDEDCARKHLALVRAYPHKHYVELSVRGPHPQNFFALLKDGFELTLARFPGLEIKRKILCPGHGGQTCSYEFDHKLLLERLKRGKHTVECQESLEEMSVTELLYGWDWHSTQGQVLERMDKLEENLAVKISESNTEVVSELRELRQLARREFTAAFRREQKKLEAFCPGVFALRPEQGSDFSKILRGAKLKLQLYCEEPDCWHPPRPQDGGLYLIDESAKWLRAAAPWLKKLAGMLKYASLAGAGLNWFDDEELYKQVDEDIKLLGELHKQMDIEAQSTAHTEESHRAEGEALRALHSLLLEKDPHKYWGGLRPVLTPEGHYLWLCEEHAQRYRD
ncbi:MAG: GTPase [Gammaproteobacteria bacterium]|nr:GTPase [Gammaproteobacteria bacterium]